MILTALLHRLWKGLDRQATEHLTERQLRQLEPHLLRDVGLVRDGNRIRPIEAARLTVAPVSLPDQPVATAGVTGLPVLPQVDGG